MGSLPVSGPRIVIVGAGGWEFPVQLCHDILGYPSLSNGEIILYDIDVAAAERTLGYVEELIDIARVPARCRVVQGLRDALRGATFVVTVFQVGGVEAYAHDVLIPREYGIDQTVGDTLGPGGVFRGLRAVEALRVIAEAMIDVSPGALLLNYTNPMSINCWAADLFGVNVVGLCHSVQGTSRFLAQELDVPYDEVTYDCAGVNHTAWFTTFRRGQEDLIPRIREVMTERHLTQPPLIEELLDDRRAHHPGKERVRTELMRLSGYWHTESSHHASEYWAWFRKGPEVTQTFISRRWDAFDLSMERDGRDRNREIVDEARARGISPSAEYAAPIMDAVVTGRPLVVYVNVRNAGAITNLPPDACVEVACVADRHGVRALGYGDLPMICAALNQAQVNVQRLAAHGAMSGRHDLVQAAIALDPLTSAQLTLPQIREMVDRMFEAERAWLPQFVSAGASR